MSAPVAAAAGEGVGAAAAAAPTSEAAATGAGTAAKKTTGTRRRKPVDQGYIDALKKGDRKKGAPKPEPDAAPDTTEVRMPSVTVPAAVDTGAGVILAGLFWWWVGLPFLAGGLSAVKNQLRAKFFNKASDGSWLP
jgi:hypothetical protein